MLSALQAVLENLLQTKNFQEWLFMIKVKLVGVFFVNKFDCV